MEHSVYLNLQKFNAEARKELNSFIDFLMYKYRIREEEISKSGSNKKHFTALGIDTKGFKFNRDEANER